jgi:hypothetical protein
MKLHVGRKSFGQILILMKFPSKFIVH